MNDISLNESHIESLLDYSRGADTRDCASALACAQPDISTLAVLLSRAASPLIERMAMKARELTRRNFGSTIQLYAPLYISDFCSGTCAYCGFAANRGRRRRRLSIEEMTAEMSALEKIGFEEILLLTGERTPEADFDYLRSAAASAAERFHLVSIETFPMSRDEYQILLDTGCSGITIYQETYDTRVYRLMHGRGPKSDYHARLDTPARALSAGFRFANMGILLGLADPVADALCLFHHVEHLKKTFWQAGFSISFPRIRPQLGGFVPPCPVEDAFLAQMIFAFRICLPDTPLVLSTRESARFRDGIAGIGISKMSVASRTTVGGYHDESLTAHGQFETSDTRDAPSFCKMLRNKGLEPVFKNWDSAYR